MDEPSAKRFKATEVTILKGGDLNSTNKWFQGNNKGAKVSAIYARQSTERQCTLDEQIMDCTKYLKDTGKRKALLFTDQGSAWNKDSSDNLYGMNHLMRCVSRGYIDNIAVYDISRLSRNMDMGIKLMKGIKKYDLNVHSVINNRIYDSSPQSCDEFLEKILEAQKSSTLLSERIKTKFKHMKAKGYKFGKARYGYKAVKVDGIRKFAPEKDETNMIKLIKERYRKSPLIANVTKWLIEKGYTKRGTKWTNQKVSEIVYNKFNMSDLQDCLTD